MAKGGSGCKSAAPNLACQGKRAGREKRDAESKLKKEIQETVSEEEEKILFALILMLNKVCLF